MKIEHFKHIIEVHFFHMGILFTLTLVALYDNSAVHRLQVI